MLNLYGKYHFAKTPRINTLAASVLQLLDYMPRGNVDSISIEAIQSSGIEGYYSTIDKLYNPNVCDDSTKKVRANVSVLNYILDNRLDTISHDTICKINSQFTETLMRDYRSNPVSVIDSISGEVVHQGSKPEYVHREMTQLIAFFNDMELLSDTDKIIKSICIHYIFVDIHPFPDGNGRTARSLQYMYLISRLSRKFSRFSISYAGKARLSKYYKSLQTVEKSHFDLTSFIEAALEMMVISIQTVINLDMIEQLAVQLQGQLGVLTTPMLWGETTEYLDQWEAIARRLPKLLIKGKISSKKLAQVMNIQQKDIVALFTRLSDLLTSLNLDWDGTFLRMKLPYVEVMNDD